MTLNTVKHSWNSYKLTELASVNPAKNKDLPHNGMQVTFVPMECVDDINGTLVNPKVRDISEVSKGYTFFKNNDVIFAKITPCMENGKCAVVNNLENGIGFGSTEFHVVRAGEGILPEYLWLFLRQENLRKQAKQSFTGASGHKRVPKEFLENIQVLVPVKNNAPDLLEQKRIVSEINKILSIRKLSTDDIQKAESLINSIYFSVFESISKHSKRALNEVCEIIKGSFPTLKTPSGEYKFVVTAADRKTADNYQFNDEVVCIPLVSSTGHGHASIKRIHYEEGKFALANIMAGLISKNKTVLLPKYLFYYLSYYKDSLLVSLMRGGANVTIPIRDLGGVKVSVPPIEEQIKVSTILTKIEALQKLLLEKQMLNNQLLESTVDYVFQGKI